MPSRTRSTVRTYVPPCSGVAIFTFAATVAPGATSAASGVRSPSHTTVLPEASCQWYETAIAFAPAAFHAAAPVFFRFAATVYVPPAIMGGTAVALICSTYAACARTGIGTLGGNQVTPSLTSAKRSWYCAGSFGTSTFAVTVFDAVGAMSPPSPVRIPSHATTVWPVASYQWYVRFTGLLPPAVH